MAHLKKEDVKKLEKQGFLLISEAAQRINRTRALIDRLVRQQRIGYVVFAQTKFVDIKSLKKFYKVTKGKK